MGVKLAAILFKSNGLIVKLDGFYYIIFEWLSQTYSADHKIINHLKLSINVKIPNPAGSAIALRIFFIGNAQLQCMFLIR